ncbi:hypothetical protein NIES4075_66560 [Tolypothrix sp. NIES-4075]|uniref:hypothetical protein n=1 Tax=Tolypothrix sp. NIES-4075 TaxID=2005459 RepID=UPI000B70869B|nr:hypothetical protein [Tolypothrix sp. NIES-4075]GAX45635.1 hypothetical protein NIES4075_66560 [Tolypothrix sp. NIES-4075]
MHRLNFWLRLTLVTMLSAMVLCQQPAFAWNKAGHMVSGAIAYSELKQSNQQKIDRIVAILREHPEFSKFEQQWNSLTGLKRKKKLNRLTIIMQSVFQVDN